MQRTWVLVPAVLLGVLVPPLGAPLDGQDRVALTASQRAAEHRLVTATETASWHCTLPHRDRSDRFLGEPGPPPLLVSEPATSSLGPSSAATPGSPPGAPGAGRTEAEPVPKPVPDFGTGSGQNQRGRLSGTLSRPDSANAFSFTLHAGEVFAATARDGAGLLELRDPEGTLVQAAAVDRSGTYPDSSPLLGGGNATVDHVVAVTGTHTLTVRRGATAPEPVPTDRSSASGAPSISAAPTQGSGAPTQATPSTSGAPSPQGGPATSAPASGAPAEATSVPTTPSAVAPPSEAPAAPAAPSASEAPGAPGAAEPGSALTTSRSPSAAANSLTGPAAPVPSAAADSPTGPAAPVPSAAADSPTGQAAPVPSTAPTSTTRSDGAYRVDIGIFRPASAPAQKIVLEFGGAKIDIRRFGIETANPEPTLSPLRTFLPGWGLQPGDEAALIARVTGTVREILADTVGGTGIEVIDASRPEVSTFGQSGVSRVVIGGSAAEAGVATVGISESVDPGNFAREETALVLLERLSGPAEDPVSLGHYLKAPIEPSARVDFVGRALGNIAAHEAGHLLGSWHTDAGSGRHDLMAPGDVVGAFGFGADQLGGTADDQRTRFGQDRYDPDEGFTGTEDTRNRTMVGLRGPADPNTG